MPPSKKPEDIIRRALDKAGLVHDYALNSVIPHRPIEECRKILNGSQELTRKDINYLEQNLGLTREDLDIPDMILGNRS